MNGFVVSLGLKRSKKSGLLKYAASMHAFVCICMHLRRQLNDTRKGGTFDG